MPNSRALAQACGAGDALATNRESRQRRPDEGS
jgi:hypothetical protein